MAVWNLGRKGGGKGPFGSAGVRTLFRTGRLVLALFVLVGCGVSFDSIAMLEGVRVMAVQKSKPYAQPGDEVMLRMLYHDDTPKERDVQVLWLSGCRNPPGDLYQLCLLGFEAALQELDIPPVPGRDVSNAEALLMLAGDEGLSQLSDSGFGAGLGETFSLMVDPEVIASRPPPKDPKIPRYGLEYVFFAACAGRLWLNDEAGEFPLACFDDNAEKVGADRFVVGYTAVYVYEEVTNRNPRITALEIKRKGTWRELADATTCIGAECATLHTEAGTQCSGDESVVLEACEDEDQPEECDKLEFRAIVDEESVDVDGILTRSAKSPVSEQMWLSYHVDRGRLSPALKLVNDITSGFQTATESELVAPEQEGVAHVWAIARDNRGGTDWARFDVCVTPHESE